MGTTSKSESYDAFMSYASEDKDSVALPLAQILASRGMRVWIDTAQVRTGDSIRRSIDSGLACSRFCIAILSPAYFAKEWTQKELDAMLAKETPGKTVVLPVLHNLEPSELALHSPILTARNLVTTSKGLNFVAQEALMAIERGKFRDMAAEPTLLVPPMPESSPFEYLSHSKAIARLYEILAEHNIGDTDSVRALGTKRRDHLDTSMYGWFAAYREAFLYHIRDAAHLDLCLGWGNRTRAFSENAHYGTAVKKLTTMSNCAVLTVPELRAPGSQRKFVPGAWYELVIRFRPLIESGLLLIIPQSVSLLKKEQAQTAGPNPGVLVGWPPMIWQERWFLLREVLPSLAVVDLSQRRLAAQMYERDSNQKPVAAQPIYVYLPHLRNVPLQTLVDLRQHQGDAFALYSSTITSFFRKSSIASTEHKLLEIMQETDERIRQIEAEFRKLSSSAVLQAIGFAVETTVGSTLCAFAPTSAAPILAALIASRALTRGLEYFKLRAEQKSILAGESFFFPWLLHQQSTKRPRHGIA